MRRWMFGWIAAAVAVVAALVIATDIEARRDNAAIDGALRTVSAARAAGADVTPTKVQPIDAALEVPARRRGFSP